MMSEELWLAQVVAAEKHGLCMPRKPKRVMRPFPGRLITLYCEKSGKRIRDADGKCQGCEPWGV